MEFLMVKKKLFSPPHIKLKHILKNPQDITEKRLLQILIWPVSRFIKIKEGVFIGPDYDKRKKIVTKIETNERKAW